jgi:hypothetical protein
MILLSFIYIGFLLFICVGMIWHYEEKLTKAKDGQLDAMIQLNNYKASTNSRHYTQIQLEYNQLKKDYNLLNKEFEETYAAYCNVSELAQQYKELAKKSKA